MTEELWNQPPHVRRGAEARRLAAEALHEGPEEPLHEAVKVKPGLHWRLRDVRGARAVGYLPERPAYRAQNQTKREGCFRDEAKPSKPLDFKHRTVGSGVCLAQFQACFGSVSSL